MSKGIANERTDPVDELLTEVAQKKANSHWEVWKAVVLPLTLNFDQSSWGYMLEE